MRKNTGIKDVKGTAIYESDILADEDGSQCDGGKVIWDGEEWLVENWHCGGQPIQEHLIVVGNVLDQPDLWACSLEKSGDYLRMNNG